MSKILRFKTKKELRSEYGDQWRLGSGEYRILKKMDYLLGSPLSLEESKRIQIFHTYTMHTLNNHDWEIEQWMTTKLEVTEVNDE